MKLRCHVVAWLLLTLVSTTAMAGTIPVRLELLSESPLHLGLGEIRDVPIEVRVLRSSDDEPLAGVRVEFFVNALICMPMMPCAPVHPNLHGAFIPPPFGSPGTIVVSSDAQGVARSPAFRAGTEPGVYLLGMGVFLMAGQSYTSAGSDIPSVQVLQGGALIFPPDASPALIPVDGRAGQGLLVILFLLSAAWLMRRR